MFGEVPVRDLPMGSRFILWGIAYRLSRVLPLGTSRALFHGLLPWCGDCDHQIHPRRDRCAGGTPA